VYALFNRDEGKSLSPFTYKVNLMVVNNTSKALCLGSKDKKEAKMILRIVRTGLLMVFAFALCSGVWAENVYLLNLDKGELPNDASGMEYKLTNEYAKEGKFSLKITAPAGGGGWIGQWNPKIKDWSSYDSLKFNYFNPSQEIISAALTITPVGGGYNERLDQKIVLRPGEGTAEVRLKGAVNNSGGDLNLSNLQKWNINSLKSGAVIYISNLHFEKEGGSTESAATAAVAPVSVEKKPEEATGKKMYLFNPDKGELPNEGSISLSEEHAAKEGKLSLKVTFTGGSFGTWGVRKSNWSDFSFLKMTVYNPSEDIISTIFSLRDDSTPADYGNRFDAAIILPPGKSTQTIGLQGISNNSGGPFNLQKIRQWFMFVTAPKPTKEKPVILYFSDVILTTTED